MNPSLLAIKLATALPFESAGRALAGEITRAPMNRYYRFAGGNTAEAASTGAKATYDNFFNGGSAQHVADMFKSQLGSGKAMLSNGAAGASLGGLLSGLIESQNPDSMNGADHLRMVGGQAASFAGTMAGLGHGVGKGKNLMRALVGAAKLKGGAGLMKALGITGMVGGGLGGAVLGGIPGAMIMPEKIKKTASMLGRAVPLALPFGGIGRNLAKGVGKKMPWSTLGLVGSAGLAGGVAGHASGQRKGQREGMFRGLEHGLQAGRQAVGQQGFLGRLFKPTSPFDQLLQSLSQARG